MINSLLSTDNLFSTESILQWIQERNDTVKVSVERIPFDQMANWYTDENGTLRHASGRFFSIQGIHIETDYGRVATWDQPIINQPEIGFLGVLTKEINGVLYFLMQAKVEPGNVNCVQISPTLQATKSNYSQIHKGKEPAYLEYFRKAKSEDILLDQLQSEQGARFLRKRNRNIIIRVCENIEVLPDFKWMTLGQIKKLIRYNNVVNMDTRTVLSGINLTDYSTPLISLHGMSQFGKDMMKSAKTEDGYYSMGHILSWLTSLKSEYDLIVSNKAIDKLEGWHKSDYEITNDENKYFKVIGVRVSISNREVSSWCQPLVQPLQQGLCAFIIRKIGGIYHFLVQAKMECGNYDVLELAPTVHSLTDNLKNYKGVERALFTDAVLNAPKSAIVYDVLQSEEGGRFYQEQNRNMIVEVGKDFPKDKLPKRYMWMTLKQINNFLKFNNFINIQARSILSAIAYK